MKRLVKLTNGNTTLNLSQSVQAKKYRVSLFEWSNGSTAQTIHIKIDFNARNYDETNLLYYNHFFMAHASGNITFTPNEEDPWFSCKNLSNHSIQLYLNGSMAGDITSNNCYIELEDQ